MVQAKVQQIASGFLLFFCWWAQVAVASGVELRIAALEETEPRYVRGKDGIAAGMCVELLQALERAEPTLKFIGRDRWMPVIRAQAEVFAGRQDGACGLAVTQERQKHMTFLQPALIGVDYVLVARADDDIVIDSWDDVRNLGQDGIVLANRGQFANEFLSRLSGIFYDTGSATSEQNFHKLLVRRGRFFFQRTHGLLASLQRAQVADKVRIMPTVMAHTSVYLVLGNHVDSAAKSKVQRALLQIEASGELDNIRKRWF